MGTSAINDSHTQQEKGKQEMKKKIKEFSDWTVEEMAEYVMTGRKPMKE